MLTMFKSRAMPVLMATFVVLGATSAFADGNITIGGKGSLIDFAALAADIQPLIATAVTAAAGIGAVVLAAMVCWRFFKRFISG